TKDVIKTVILDDVIMSIDITHRRAVCQLLKRVFPDKQFIITTHDTTWAKQLKAEGVVTQENMIHFVNWNIDTGPIFELDKDLWTRIKEDLNKNDVPSAAHKLRRNAEYFFENVCDFLGADIRYKGDHQWEFGNYAQSAISVYKKYLRRGKLNYQKMKQPEKAKELEELEKKATEIITRSQIEQWIINENVHYNKWGEFDKRDFEPVVEAFSDLFGLFSCSSCGATIAVSQRKEGTPKTIVSCSCGKIFWPIE
ncbi:chromosome segregation protein SMC, partial [Candidatus Bathyarchaeota archaeon]|nr:chromosome segregation protein SMC [Candidatus Bathyarchaeota archaeon]